jgi:hypothetical protein
LRGGFGRTGFGLTGMIVARSSLPPGFRGDGFAGFFPYMDRVLLKALFLSASVLRLFLS